jgi:hypothetical protein
LDGADTGSMTLSGSSVTQWMDKSGRGFNVATSSGATAPLYNSSTKELQFVSGNSNSFTIPQAFGDALVGTTFSFFFIGRRTVNTTYVYFLSGATSGGNQNLFIGFLSNKMEIGEYGPYASADIPTFNSPDPMRLYYYDIQSSTTANLIMNGNPLSTTVSGNLFLTSFAQPELGRRYGGAVYHDFNLSEMVVFSPALSTSQRQQVEGYLAHKWGLNTTYGTNTPLSIPGCQLWLDGADSSSLVLSGSNVTQWNDKSGNGFNGTVVNASVANPIAPSYVINSINGLSAVTMSGTSYFTGSTNVNSTTLTAFFIGNCVFGTGGSSQQRILGLSVPGSNDYSSTLRPIPLSVISGGTRLLAYRNANMAAATVVSGTNFIGCCLFDGTSNYMYKDGTLGTQVASSGTFTTSIYGVGSDAGPQFMGGVNSLGTNCLVG